MTDINQAIDEAIQSLVKRHREQIERTTERLREARGQLKEVNDAFDAQIRRYNVKHHSQSPVRLVKGNGEY
jgi:predicted outer membrane protein